MKMSIIVRDDVPLKMNFTGNKMKKKSNKWASGRPGKLAGGLLTPMVEMDA